VRECAVVAREDNLGDKRLVAYFVAKAGQTLLSSELRAFLDSRLPEYMVPSAFVTLEVLPQTPSGKVDRRALPAPDQTRSEAAEEFVAPRTPIEEVLAEIWAQVLHLDRVGIHDNFFDLGGHSLLATQVASRVKQALQLELPLRRLFEAPRVSDLAIIVAQLMIEDSENQMSSTIEA
jgi:acyl carrier protein